MKNLVKRGATILMASHDIFRVRESCDRIGILSKGNLVALDGTKNLIDKIKTKVVTFTTDKKLDVNKIDLNKLKIISNNNTKITVSYDKSLIKIEDIFLYFSNQNIRILDITTDDADIEDVYLGLTKN